MVKLLQTIFINYDIDMYDNKTNIHSKAINSSLNEELGQVKYIFSDKTGTLTSNELIFRHALIGETFVGDIAFLNKIAFKEKEKKSKDNTLNFNKLKNTSTFNDLLDTSNRKQLERMTSNECYITEEKEKELTVLFFLTLALCHDCVFEKPTDDKKEGEYHGMSPDDIVLLNTAKKFGFEYLGSKFNNKIIKINNQIEEIPVLNFFEFNSARKRSSIIIKYDGKILLLVKGADSVILDRINRKLSDSYNSEVSDILECFSNEGLRTLCYAVKELSEDELSNIEKTLKSFSLKQNKEELEEEFISSFERDLRLIGCTAVEDLLQEQVPSVIADLITANIKVWMLTGDKLETAENIAMSCKLIQKDFVKLYLKSKDNIDEQYDKLKAIIRDNINIKKITMIIEGEAITKIVSKKFTCLNYVRDILSKCDSVICCRMSPNGKGDIVSMVKDNLKCITLAIGDGANDVNMIKRADIGIGLYGKEGLRAVQASDFALPNFKSLWKLIFIHGRWSYMRNSEMVLYFFYKNMIFVVPQFIFIFYNGFSSQTIYDEFYINFYNLIFTSLPVMFKAVFDQDIYYKKWTTKIKSSIHRKKVLVENKLLKSFFPYLYYVGQEDKIFKLS